MRPRDRRRVWAFVIAVAMGFAAGWLARTWTTPSPESRARDTFERMRERARELTR